MPVPSSGHDARGVANFLIHQGIDGSHGPYTPLQVIKLTYLCHGWMLGLHDRPISAQPVEAWQYGPVIPDVYHRVKIHGREPIKQPLRFPIPEFDDLETDLVSQVIDAYGEFSGIQLSQMTHQPGTPWHKVWHQYGQNTIIPNHMIQQHFAGLASE